MNVEIPTAFGWMCSFHEGFLWGNDVTGTGCSEDLDNCDPNSGSLCPTTEGKSYQSDICKLWPATTSHLLSLSLTSFRGKMDGAICSRRSWALGNADQTADATYPLILLALFVADSPNQTYVLVGYK